ncbi:uncharacterized protein LOC124192399 isoform X2 [Daphnia pulex]|uniref:uncharacterized protein LOC124192399 isoform X2 n=1 Tax=Daphnia pulex TaxID=6669 RepID=UPI001EDF9951|nr:uncharacterized protein LOC124192399 isoform X2 [Daphnia pulex]
MTLPSGFPVKKQGLHSLDAVWLHSIRFAACDMEPRNYKCGDVVWVMAGKRLGWWAGRVENVEELRQDLVGDVNDKTIAVVKYLNEENYQFVEDEAIICAYDSDRKEEYISIGMKKYFEKKRLNETSSPFIKFANNVKQAEQLTGGNPDIVDDEKYQPKKAVPAQSKYKDIFVDPRVKELKPKSPIKGGATSSPRRPGRPPAKEVVTPKVNHPRFQGQSDHEVRIRRQEKSPATGSPGVGEYKCDSCSFQTTRLNLMVFHKKSEHLKSSNTATTRTPTTTNITKQRAAQKRPLNSPTKKTTSKKSKTVAEPEPDGDLFDQIKRNLEPKETTDSKPSPQSKTSVKASPKVAKTPKPPRTPRSAKVATAATSAKTPTVKANDTKTQFNPKKKWLKSLQKEANPEVKNKLMADWDEDDEEEKQQQIQRTEVSSTNTESQVEPTADSDSDDDTRPSKSGLLHQRSDDEEDDDDDAAIETDTPILKSPEKITQDDEEASNTEASFIAGISAEIDKLNADLDATNHETRSSKINGEPESTNSLSPRKDTSPAFVNGVESPSRDPQPSKGEEEIKLDVASLLAETSVPIIPDITELSKVVENEVGKRKSSQSDDEEMEQEVENEEIEKSNAEAPVEHGEMDQVVENEIEKTNSDPPVNEEEKIDQAVENEIEKTNSDPPVNEEEKMDQAVENEIEKTNSDPSEDLEEKMDQAVENEVEKTISDPSEDLEENINQVDENEVENTISDPSVNVEESMNQVDENEVAKANPEQTMEEEELGQLQDNDAKINENLEPSTNAREMDQVVVEEEKNIFCETLSVEKEVTAVALPENGIETVLENGVEVAVENEEEIVSMTQNGEATEVVTTNGGSNILMQVEGGETYMVVWEPGSNIHEFLECGGDGEDTGGTQTLLIDPSSLQAGSDLENLFQMAVAASAVSQPQQNEQSNPTTSVTSKDGKRSTKCASSKGTPTKGNKSQLAEELLNKHGDAVNKELEPNTLVWYKKSPRLFLPGAVIESSDPKSMTLLAFNIEQPNNQCKYQRNRVIAAFHHELNLELLTFGRTRNKAADRQKLDFFFDHASSFSDLRNKPNFTQLTARQYLTSCHRSPVKLFSERYLTSSPEMMDLSLFMDNSDSEEETVVESEEELSRRREIVNTMLEKHVLTDSCLQHLADFVESPSEERAFRLNLYESKSWIQLTRSATTSGILENSRELYSKVADFLDENVHRVRKLKEGIDHKRAFVLDLLMPEALVYGVQQTFHVTYQEAKEMVVYGLKNVSVNTSI